ncbi:MAG TPA: outer membrane beta-barrel protein [bacterium]|nr:outer membrane beta-barrel protein [bacterium]HPJ71771.1 outer membrane beta-barrel protein [bacterium]HPQ65297.1 outer membrane beta-barrel protein [bacterium]
MRNLAVTVLAAGLLVFAAGSVPAQVGVEAHGLYTFEYSNADISTNEEFGGGASLAWKICPYFRIDAGADYYGPKVRGCQYAPDDLRAEFIPVTIGAGVGGFITEGFYLFMGGGTGWSFNHLKHGDGSDLKDGIVWFAYGMLEFFLTDNLALQAQYRYTWLRADLKNLDFDLEHKDLNFDHMEARLGLAFYF